MGNLKILARFSEFGRMALGLAMAGATVKFAIGDDCMAFSTASAFIQAVKALGQGSELFVADGEAEA